MNTTLERVDQPRWRELAGSFLDYNYRQLWPFSWACADRRGATVDHIAILRDSKVLGLAGVRVKRTPVFKTGIAYINGAPLVRRGTPTDAERLLVCLRSLVAEYVRRRQMVLRVNGALGPPGWNETQTGLFAGAGFVPATSGKPYRTILVDINREPDEIRKSFPITGEPI